MDRHLLLERDRAQFVDWFADDVHHASESSLPHGNRDGTALVDGLHSAHHAVGGRHGDAPHTTFAQVLLHFEHNADGRRHGEAIADDAQRLVNRGHRALDKLYVDSGSGNLNYMSNIFSHKTSKLTVAVTSSLPLRSQSR